MARFRMNSVAMDDYDIDATSQTEGQAIGSVRRKGVVASRPKPKRQATTAQGPRGRSRRKGLALSV